MKIGARVLAAWLWLCTCAAAQDTTTPSADVQERDVIHLLDEIPNYDEILRDQWSPDVPADVRAAQQSTEYYGRLLDTEPTVATSLPQCIALALRNNTDLQIQRLGPVSAANGIRQARSQFDPRLFSNVSKDRTQIPSTTLLFAGTSTRQVTNDFNADLGVRKFLLSGGLLELKWSNTRYYPTASIATPLVPQYTSNLGLSLNQPLLRDFGWRYSLLLVDVAETTAESAFYQYQAGIANLIGQVERAYWNLVLAIQTVKVAEQGLALAQETQRQNEGRFNVGAMAQTAVLEAKSQVAQREATLIQARNLRDIQRDNVRALINARNPQAAALISIEPQDWPAVQPYEINLDRSLKAALGLRPELVAARFDVQGKGLQRKIAENQLLPRLNLVAGIGLTGVSGTDAKVPLGSAIVGTNPTPGLEPAPTPALVPVNQDVLGGYSHALDLMTRGDFYNYVAGVTIEIPIDNAQAKANYAQANVNFDSSRLSLQKLQETVTLEIKTAVTNLQTDLKSIEATRIARELAEENLRNQQARYDVGLATTKDILDFQDQLTRARFAEIQALTSYNVDVAEMRRVEGTLLDARNVVVERVSAGATPWWAQF